MQRKRIKSINLQTEFRWNAISNHIWKVLILSENHFEPLKSNYTFSENDKINGKTMEEVLGKDWEEKFNNLKGEEIIKERERLKRLIDTEVIKEKLGIK